jgi:hypothetical protein
MKMFSPIALVASVDPRRDPDVAPRMPPPEVA